jgi:hypothetical protein
LDHVRWAFEDDGRIVLGISSRAGMSLHLPLGLLVAVPSMRFPCGTRHKRFGSGPKGYAAGMTDRDARPGPLAPEKTSDDASQGHAEPDAAEVESARLLANDARATLTADGLDDEEIRRLADEYVALDLGEDVDDFVAWSRDRRRGSR